TTLENDHYVYNWIAQAGIHTFYAIAYDLENNRNVSSKLMVNVGGDTKKPELSVSHPESVLPGTYFTVKLIASDESGIKKINFSDLYGKNETENFSGIQKVIDKSFNVLAREEGKYSFDITVYDNALNMSNYHGEIRIGENQAPTVILTAPQSAETGDKVTLSAIANDVDGTIQRVIFYVDSSQIAVDTTQPYSADWVAVSGRHVLRAEAYDDSGLMGYDEKTINVSIKDQTPPEITFMPQEKYPANTSNRLFAIVKDDSGVEDVEFYSNDELISKGQKWPGNVYVCSWIEDATGTYILTVKAKDIFGNTNEVSAAVSVVTLEEYEMPQITQFILNKTVLDMGDYLEVTVSAQDKDGLALAELYVDNVKVDSRGPQGNTFVLKWLANKIGNFKVKVLVFDKKGYTAHVENEIRVETVRPLAKITSPASGTRRLFSDELNITLSATVSDSSTPSAYRFDVVGPEDTIPIVPKISGFSGHYVFDATWYPTEPGDYRIFFRYTDENNFSAEDVVNVKIVNANIVIAQPLNYSQMECGYPLDVTVEAGEDVSSVELALKLAGNVIWSDWGKKNGNVFIATIPSTVIKILDWFTLTATSSTQMNEKFTDESVFRTIDTTPPTFTVAIDGQRINGGEVFEKTVYDVFDITVNATDNHEIGSIEIFRNDVSIFRNTDASFTTQETCQPFENDYVIKVQDPSGNSVQTQFTIIASETNKPELNAQITTSLSEIHVDDDLVVTISFNATDDILIDRFDVIFPDKTFSWNVDRSFVSTSVSISWTAPSIPGEYPITLKVVDVFGNYNTFEHTIDVMDVTAPMVEISASPIVNGTVDVTVRAFDNDTQTPAQSVTLKAKNPDGTIVNLGSPYYSNNGVFKYNFFTTAAMDGPVTLIATTPDGGYDELTVIVDNYKPEIESISLPFAPEFGYPEPVPVFSGPFSVSCEVGEVPVPYDVKWVKFLFNDQEVQRLDGTLYQYNDQKYTYTSSLIDPGDLEDGYASITTVVCDKADNLATLTTKAIFDTTPPQLDSLENATLENNKIYTNENTLTFRATDLTLDTSLPSPKLYFRKGTFAYIIEANDDPKKLPSGVVEYGEYDYSSIASNDLYTLEFDLEDIAGNSTTLSYNFYYDTISPVINVIQPIDGVTIGPDGTDIIAEIHDNLSGTKELKMNISYGTLQQTTWYDPQSTVSSHWDPPMDVEMDNVVLTVVATDHCQNVSSTSVVLAVDTLAPRINLESSNISTSTVSATQVNLAATIVLNVQDENINFGTLDATMILTSSTILLSNYSTSGTVPDYVATLTFSDTVSST
ncbi:MAG: Ig-like domain-containing protein, partial [Candidatus Thorarchaeota archaeon]